tara:strand:+ start:48 stop:836 length:789 start_codon:yes stop_codon:yes gene_type:complete
MEYEPGHPKCRGRLEEHCLQPACVWTRPGQCREATNMTRRRRTRANLNWNKSILKLKALNRFRNPEWLDNEVEQLVTQDPVEYERIQNGIEREFTINNSDLFRDRIRDEIFYKEPHYELIGEEGNWIHKLVYDPDLVRDVRVIRNALNLKYGDIILIEYVRRGWDGYNIYGDDSFESQQYIFLLDDDEFEIGGRGDGDGIYNQLGNPEIRYELIKRYIRFPSDKVFWGDNGDNYLVFGMEGWDYHLFALDHYYPYHHVVDEI